MTGGHLLPCLKALVGLLTLTCLGGPRGMRERNSLERNCFLPLREGEQLPGRNCFLPLEG